MGVLQLRVGLKPVGLFVRDLGLLVAVDFSMSHTAYLHHLLVAQSCPVGVAARAPSPPVIHLAVAALAPLASYGHLFGFCCFCT